jgi:CRP-like cAMP-binding protein
VGDIADGMYFIQAGAVDITTDQGDLLTQLGVGAYFGEFAVLAELKV